MADYADLVAHMADRFAIDEVLVRYCRGINRCDGDALRQVFATTAQLDYGDGPQARDGMIDRLLAALRAMRSTQHSIANTLLRIDGDSACAESYCVAVHILGLPGHWIEMVIGGRYLDKLARISGGSQITERCYVMDWNRQGPSTIQDSGGLYDTLQRRGARWPDDASYAWWGSAPA